MKKPVLFTVLFTILYLPLVSPLTRANDIVNVKNIGMELARDIASDAIKACREMGYQVSAVVVDRNGLTRAMLRDDLASRFTLQLAEEKANTSILGGVASSEIRKSRGDIRPELNHVKGILVLEGGLPISTGGYRIGALGVSGAPGGDIDEKCAQKALENIEDRLEFASE
jgi:uncharacterized protein GlcG (DUF336 family)